MSVPELIGTLLALAVIAAFGIWAYARWPSTSGKWRYGAVVLAFSLFIGIYSLQFLSIELQMPGVALERRLDTLAHQQQSIAKQQEQIRRIVTATVKMVYAAASADVTSRAPQRRQLLLHYTQELAPYLDSAEMRGLLQDIRRLYGIELPTDTASTP